MTIPLRFDAATISDQKRLVRGEHLLLARTKLRARDCVHNGAWRILIMAGGSPSGEIRAIRELMPKAHITAVDIDERCLSAAIDAGVDEVVQCDLAAFTKNGSGGLRPTAELRAKPKFDVVILDLCSVPNFLTRQLFKVNRILSKLDGIYIFTFAYGRDVIEAIEACSVSQRLASLSNQGCSDRMLKRIEFIVDTPCSLESVMTYKGKEMPMCSLFLRNRGWNSPISFVKVDPGDFELAVVYPNAANLYDCPQERIEALRRRFAALKAALTRTKKASSPLPFEEEDRS